MMMMMMMIKTKTKSMFITKISLFAGNRFLPLYTFVIIGNRIDWFIRSVGPLLDDATLTEQ